MTSEWKNDDWNVPLRVNVYEKAQLDYWTARFGCTREELRRTVFKVGVSTELVMRAMTTRVPAEAAGRT
jgi:hypothetical protein